MSLEITLQNAISGLQTAKTSIQIISNNIANVNTEGYSRKIIEPTSRVIGGVGFGVEIAQITRNIDEGILRQLRNETGTLEKLSIKDIFLSQINNLFGRPADNNSITHSLAELASQFDSLAISPETNATQFLTVKAATNVVSELQRMSDEIQRLRSEANLKISVTVTEFNNAMDSVVTTNFNIIQFTASRISTADLEDQRDAAINIMSNILDINYFTQSNGAITVFTGGGATLISGQKQEMIYNRPALMAPTLEYTKTSATNYISPGSTGYPVGGIPGLFIGEQIKQGDITSTISSGRLKGLLDMRDLELPALQAQIDELAEKLKDQINSVHNKGAGFPPAPTLTGDRFVASTTSFSGSGIVRIGITNESGVLQEDLILTLSTYSTVGDLVTALDAMTNMSASLNSNGELELSGENDFRVSINELTSSIDAAGDVGKGFSDFFGLNNFFSSSETFARYRSDLFTSQSSSAITTGGTVQFTASGLNLSLAYSTNDSLATIATTINGDATLAAANITAEVIADGSGFRLQIIDSDGDEFAIVETASGTLISDTNIRTDVRGLSSRIAVRTDIVSNSFYVSRGALQSNMFESANFTGSTQTVGAVPLTAGTMTFTIDSSTSVAIAYATTDTLTSIASSINNNATLQAANITAEIIIDGSNFRLKIVDGESDNFHISDTAGGLNMDTSQGLTIGDGSVAADLAAEFETSISFLAAPSKGNGLPAATTTLGDYSATILSFNSALAASVQTDLRFQTALQNELFAKNTSISGVNLDEELATMIIFEQAYLASARMIAVTQELFKVLSDMLRN